MAQQPKVFETILDHQTGHLFEIKQDELGRFYSLESWEDEDGYHTDDDFYFDTIEEVITALVGDDPCDEGSRFEFDPCDEPGIPWHLEA